MRLKSLAADTTQITIHLPTDYKTNIFGKAYCPKCGKADLTYRIRYGEPIYAGKINDKGDIYYDRFYNGEYQAGTCASSLQSPHWYCDRDKIEF